MPKISVIIPVYKVEQYLSRCVNSVLEQTFTDFEIILVDDGSPDRCPELCDVYASEHHNIVVCHKINGGLSSARNAGLSLARGSYIFFLDSDDWIHKSTLEILYKLAIKNQADIVSANYALVKGFEDIPKEKRSVVKVFDNEEASLFYLKTGMAKRISEFPAWGKLYRKELFSDINFPNGQLYEDVVTVFKLVKKAKKYVKTSQPLYYYFQGATSIVRSKFKFRDMDAILVGKQLVEETKFSSKKIRKYAYQKEARGYFSVLCKIGFYGIDEGVEQPEEIIQKTYIEFKKGYRKLMISPMPISRKIIAFMFRISCKGTLHILNVVSRRKQKIE